MGAMCHKTKKHNTPPKPAVNKRVQNAKLLKLIIQNELMELRIEPEEKDTDSDLTPPKLIFQRHWVPLSPRDQKNQIQNETFFGKKPKRSNSKSPRYNPIKNIVK